MYNGHDDVSNHQPYDCFLNSLVRRRTKKTSKVCVTDLFEGISPGNGELPAQRTSNAENVSIWWRHHVGPLYLRTGGTEHLSNNRLPPTPTPTPTVIVPLKFPEMQRGKLQVSPKHKETQAMSIYLGIYRIALFCILNSFGRYIWLNIFVFVFVFESMYLYLYLYLNQSWRKYFHLYLYLKNPNFCICICICIW